MSIWDRPSDYGDIDRENAQQRAEEFADDMRWPPESDEPICPECGGHGKVPHPSGLDGYFEECYTCHLASLAQNSAESSARYAGRNP